jgi:hypothetical protein
MVGEHIRALKAGRWLHAIDCGDETVLHLAEDAAPRRVRRAYRPEFVAGAQAVELVTHRERTFPPEEIVRRAYSRASDPTLATMFGDSQAFAEWCTTGRVVGPHNVAVPGLAPAVAPEATTAVRKPRGKASPAPKRKASPANRAKRNGATATKAKRAVGKVAQRKATAPKRRAAGARPTGTGRRAGRRVKRTAGAR